MVNKILTNFFVRRLPEIRRSKDITRKEIAKGVGITLGKYDKWEAGKVLPKSEDIARLASFYEMSVDEFLGLTEEESEAIKQKLIEDANKLPPDAKKRVLDSIV
ncbi:DNA-binding transcriptional regulator, XRE-family HTH domain [Selenomonas ruminantium]|uniref:DNA-binding transcriptional regulator, XRE-family HTH domain n=1 Tax=Selenomonas ruminantium TaxID=971 RepID=A0A1M6XPB2_SELRU|nr:helix-turn-helix transcriptional regulator [Selenomonas ruminantium]SHL07794.1 DNA-binding transcriptional regulator, XRE-family HTH domain [Selenomonas ruminantium]